MAKYVTMGASLQCTYGMSPSVLVVIDPTRPTIQNKFKANIMDFVPLTNIITFGMCQSMSNPTVSSATSAAMGVLTPMPCVPATTTPWNPGGKAYIQNMPALLDNCKLTCMWGGSITIKDPGHTENSTGE